MQIMPDTARRYGLANAETALRNPKVNVDLARAIFSTFNAASFGAICA
jgi:soluble lytic murein transglycosylase-like protein